MKIFKQVSETEFYEFVRDKGYVVDICGICEPAYVTYNDFSNGKKWPESKVAYCWKDAPENGYFILAERNNNEAD